MHRTVPNDSAVVLRWCAHAAHAALPASFGSVDCFRYIIVNNGNATHPSNDALAPFQAQMERIRLWPRITVQWMDRDPLGKTAGCFEGHRQAWAAALAEGCRHMMAMEEDLFYAEDEIEPSATHANAFVASGQEFDMLMLGWGSSVVHPIEQGIVTFGALDIPAEGEGNQPEYITTTKKPSVACIYRIHHWLLTHNYIISRTAMLKYNETVFFNNNTPVDVALSGGRDRNLFFAVRPAFAFQVMHTKRAASLGAAPPSPPESHAGALADFGQLLSGTPPLFASMENSLYALSGESYAPGKTCANPTSPAALAAYYEQPKQQAESFRAQLFPFLRRGTALLPTSPLPNNAIVYGATDSSGL